MVYRSEGYARTGYWIPGRDGKGGWRRPGDSSVVAAAAVVALSFLSYSGDFRQNLTYLIRNVQNPDDGFTGTHIFHQNPDDNFTEIQNIDDKFTGTHMFYQNSDDKFTEIQNPDDEFTGTHYSTSILKLIGNSSS